MCRYTLSDYCSTGLIIWTALLYGCQWRVFLLVLLEVSVEVAFFHLSCFRCMWMISFSSGGPRDMECMLVACFVDAFLMQTILCIHPAVAFVCKECLTCTMIVALHVTLKFNFDKSCAGTFGDNCPLSAHLSLASEPLRWTTHMKYLGCYIRCRSCEVLILQNLHVSYTVLLITSCMYLVLTAKKQ